MITPEIEEAKKYIDRVIDQMALSDTDLKAIITRRVKELINASYPYFYLGQSFQFSNNKTLESKVKEIFNQIHNDIFNIIFTRADNAVTLAYEKEEEKKSNKYLLAFLGLTVANLTIQDRIANYTTHLRSEIEAYIAAGVANGMNTVQILNYYIMWLKSPYKSPLLLDAFRQKGFKAERIISKGITFGEGKYIAAFNNFVRLQQDTIFRACNHTLNSIWLGNQSIIGWYTVRGSSYPCATCDDNVGEFHTKDEFFFGWHPRCCCIMLPVYDWDL